MLIKAKTVRNYKLRGIDGEFGDVAEFYFDDKYLTVRYLVANTGGWIDNRQVLISPYFLKNVDHDSKIINVDLTKNQIENSPSLELDKPVSRQYEESYNTYFGTPLYWDGPNMWGANPFILRDRNKWIRTPGNESAVPFTGENTGLTNSGNAVSTGSGISIDSHLRSTRDVSDHKIHTSDDQKIGHVDDFIIDDDSWAIRYFIIHTGNLFTGKKVLVSPQWIEKISWDDSIVYVNLTKEELKMSPQYSDEAEITRDYESLLFGYYKKPPYWSREATVSHFDR